jgi:hypothetical protein
LLISSAYILNIIGKRLNYINPYEFIEHIAVDNFCKFSIENKNNKNNKDYPQDIGKIKYSFEYIKADLRILKPKTITLPKTLYEHNDVKKLFNDIVQNCQIIPIYQISCGNINRIISKKYQKKEKSKIDDIFIEWQKHLENRITGKTNENFYSVYTYLEKIVKSTNGT